MPLSNSEKVTIVTDALKAYIPYGGSGSDTRSLADLKAAFLKQHLDSMVRSYQKDQANASLEAIATETVS
tara:strand:+ start:644 stop:853 length:210 start_codon:yes stop_codon:yes gene_type:complete